LRRPGLLDLATATNFPPLISLLPVFAVATGSPVTICRIGSAASIK